MDEFTEERIRQVIGIVSEGLEGLWQYLIGLADFLPTVYDFFKEHPDFRENFKDKTLDEIIEDIWNSLRSQFDKFAGRSPNADGTKEDELPEMAGEQEQQSKKKLLN